MDVAGYYIFMNLVANHLKNSFIKYRELALVRTAILFSSFFCFCFFFHARKMY